MRILIVTNHFWPENFRINELALGLSEKGHKVTVLTGIPNYPTGKFFLGYGLFKNARQNYHGVTVIHVPLLPRGKGGPLSLALNYFSFALCGSLLAPFLCQGSYDVIFVFQTSPITVGIPAIILKRLKNIPIIFWVLDLWPESLSATGTIHSEKILNIVSRLVRLIYRECALILVASKAFTDSIEAKGVDRGKIRFFPNWAETYYKPLYTNSRVSQLEGLPKGFRIMFAGSIGAAQDFGTILTAAEKLAPHKDIHWLILGHGRMYDWVFDQIKKRNLSNNVHLMGYYSPERMPEFFSLADVMLVTLKRDPLFALTIPGKIQSYMAFGKPIIAAVDGEAARLIKESGAGLSCPAGDANALCDAVLTMYKMPNDQREHMGEQGRIYCKLNFERTMLFDKLEVWMRELSQVKTS